MFRKFIITAICCLSIFALCAVPSYAAGFGGGQRGGGFGSGGFSSNTVSTYLSYDALSDLCAEVNYNLERNVYASDGFPSSGKYAATIVSRSDGYYIGVYKAGSYTWFRNPSGGFYICEYNTDSLLSNISSRFNLLMAENGYLRAFYNSLNSIDSRLENLMASPSGYLANINEKLGNSYSAFVSMNATLDKLMSSPSGYLANINEKLFTLISRLDTVIDQLSVSSPGSDSSGGSSSGLPDEYRRLTCVETTGQQYVNSSIYFDSSKPFQIDADVEFTNSSASQVLFGYSDDSNFASYALFLNPYPPTKNYCFRFGSNVVTSSGAFPAGSRHSVISYAVSGRQYLSIDGVNSLSSTVSSTFSGSVPCYIFGANSSSGKVAAMCYVRCYGIVIRQDGNIIRNYVPALRYADNVAGLYDLVSGVFSPSAGKPFLAGSVLANWQYNMLSGLSARLDTIIGNLPGSSSSDLTPVTTRLDTIIEQLQTTSGESGCDHTYTQDVTQAPTCILPGLQVSTCSQCGDSYSEILAALGHDWQCTSHVEAVTDPDTGEVTQSGYDIYTCSRCGDTYNDYAGDGAPSDYGDTSLSKIIVKLFSKLGTFAGKVISWIIGLFDKMLSGLNDIITRFSDLTAQITGFGGDYPTWLSGFWGILPQEFQLALTFSFVCVFIGVIGRKLFFA